MGIAEGISRGLFNVFLIIVAVFFFGIAMNITIDLFLYKTGQIKFMDMSEFSQWIAATFFNEPPDGGGYA